MASLTDTVLPYKIYTADLVEGDITNSYIILQRTSDEFTSISPNYGYQTGSLITLFQRVIDTTEFTKFDLTVSYINVTLVGTFGDYKEE